MDSAESRRPTPEPVASVHEAYERYGPALVRKAERILQNGDDAMDVVQGLFVDLMQRKAPSLELPYLYRAVGNRCLNLVRDSGNRRRLLERQEPALRGPVRTTCETRVLGLDLLMKLAEQLDERSQEILICQFWDDMTQDEIAAVLGVSRRTVVKRLAAIRELVVALDGEGAGG